MVATTPMPDTSAMMGCMAWGTVMPRPASTGRKSSPTKGTVRLRQARVTRRRQREKRKKKTLMPSLPSFMRERAQRTAMRQTGNRKSALLAAMARRSRARTRAIQA